MALADLVPDDTEAHVRWSPNANTRRVYDRNVFSNDTAFTTPPVVTLHGLPARVELDEVTIFGKPQNAIMLDPTGEDDELAGIWYTDIIVAQDPDIEPNFIYATLTHPSWEAPETRIVPSGTGKLCWTDLAVADPPDPVQIVFVGHPGGAGTPTAPVLQLGTVTETTGSPSMTVIPQATPGHYTMNFVLKTGPAGANGLSAYQQAQAAGFAGTFSEWLASLKGEEGDPGPAGPSAYQLAQSQGYGGTLTAWLASLVGATGQSAYQLAVSQGFSGTLSEWLESLQGADGVGDIDITIGSVTTGATPSVTVTETTPGEFELDFVFPTGGSSGDSVLLTGDQTIAGIKTFSSSPVVPNSSFSIAKTTGLQTALDAKADSSAMTTALAAKANSADVTAALAVKSDAGHTHAGMVSSSTITTIWTGTQTAYDAITPKDDNVLYVVVG